jgi:dynein heavy chain
MNDFIKIGEKFRNRALKFPGLISGCTIDWFQRWPKEALIAVAGHFLSNYEISCSTEIKKQLVQSMGTIHDNVADTCQNYFIKYFIYSFSFILNKNLSEIKN